MRNTTNQKDNEMTEKTLTHGDWKARFKALLSFNLPAVTISGCLSGPISFTTVVELFNPGRKIDVRGNRSGIGTATHILGYVEGDFFHEVASYDGTYGGGYGQIDNPYYNRNEYGIRKTDNSGGWETIADASDTFDRETSITEQARLDHAVAYIKEIEGYEDKVSWFSGLTQKKG